MVVMMTWLIVVQKYVPHLKRTRSFSEGDQNLEQLAHQHKKTRCFSLSRRLDQHLGPVSSLPNNLILEHVMAKLSNAEEKIASAVE